MDKFSGSGRQTGIETLSVHAGRYPESANVASAPPLFQASSYEFADLDDVEATYAGTRPGAIYGRYGGPNGAQFESAIAQLEGAQEAVGASSGMAAIGAALRAFVPSGAPIVTADALYGGTLALLENDFQQAGHRRIAVDITDIEAVARALHSTRSPVLYVEALSNPLLTVADFPALARVAHDYGARLIVDATFVSPALCRPLALGADLVVHSVGKYLGGHGDVGAGVVAGSAADCAPIRQWLIRNGATIPHFEAWLAVRGLRTLGLRMARHSANATAVAAFLAEVPAVERVYHPSRTDHRGYAAARRLYPRGTGGIVAFDLFGDRETVARFLGELELIAIVHSLGEVASTISYSAASSHRSVDPAERVRQGVTETTLRLSCGIEEPADIIADLARAFAALGPVRQPA